MVWRYDNGGGNDERDIFYAPLHPYTRGLLQSLPKTEGRTKQRLVPIKGNPPNLAYEIKGCPFADRCPYVMDICKKTPKVLLWGG